MNGDETSRESREDQRSPADRNVERLLAEAYRPVDPDAEFVRRVGAAMLSEAAKRSGSRWRRFRRPVPALYAWGSLAAAAVLAVGLMLSLFAGGDADRREPHEGMAPARGIADDGAKTISFPIALEPAGAAGLTARERAPAPAPQKAFVGGQIRTGPSQRRRVSLPDGSIAYVNQNTSLRVEGARRVSIFAGEAYFEVAPAAVIGGGAGEFVVTTPARRITALGTRFSVRQGTDTRVMVTQGRVEVSGLAGALRSGWALRCEGATGGQVTPARRASHELEWTRELVAAAAPSLVPESGYSGGALVVKDPQGRETHLSLRKVHVDVYVEDGFARTTIDQTYFNHTTRRLEGTFYFPLPPDASLSRLAMYVNGKLMEGGMAERDYARTVFESIVYRMKDPALLEWVDGTTFKMRVFPLEGRQEKRIVLSYTQRLPSAYERTTYRFPSGHSAGEVREWSFRARVKGAETAPWTCDSHALVPTFEGGDLILTGEEQDATLDRDLVLHLSDLPGGAAPDAPRFSAARHEGAEYLMLRYLPELPAGEARERRDWVFLFERSADRDTLLARVQVDVVRALLESAEHDDTFNVVIAGTRAVALSETPLPVSPDSVAAAVRFLESTHLIGALDLEQALVTARPLLSAATGAHLVHVGSGIAVLGERGVDELVQQIPAEACYVGIGVGKRWDRNFMRAAAARTGGYFTQINPDEDVAWRAFDLVSTLNAPRLVNVRVSEPTGRARFLGGTDAVAHGEEIWAVARIEPGGEMPRSVTVTGKLGDAEYARTFRVQDIRGGAGYLPRIWARMEIDRLLAEDAKTHRDRIVELSKAMYVMSPFTSLLVLENEQMYEQYKVDRGRKDHWALYPCPETIPVVHEPLETKPVGDRSKQSPKPEEPWQKKILRTILFRLPAPFFQPSDHGQAQIGHVYHWSRAATAWDLHTGAYAVPVHYWSDFNGDTTVFPLVHGPAWEVNGRILRILGGRKYLAPVNTGGHLAQPSYVHPSILTGRSDGGFLYAAGMEPTEGWWTAHYNWNFESQRPTSYSYQAPLVSMGTYESAVTYSTYSEFGSVLYAAGGIPSPSFDIQGDFLDGVQADFLLRGTSFQPSAALTPPRLTLSNGQLAHVAMTTEQFYVADLEPVAVENGTIYDPVIWLPSVTSQRLGTTVSIPDGGTLLRGGQRAWAHIEREKGIVPLIGNIPILGRLSTNRGRVRDEARLLTLIKPNIIIQREDEERWYADIGPSGGEVPWYGLLRYPADWREITRRRVPFAAGMGGEAELDRIARSKLMTRVAALDFVGTPFGDAIEFLRTVSGANIHVNWRALENSGIDETTEVKKIQLRDVTAEKALQVLLEEVDPPTDELGFVVDQGVVTISTKSDLDRKTVTRVYDIRDLIVQIQGFGGPRINIGQVGGGGLFGDTDNQGLSRRELIEQIITMIQETIDPESWRGEGLPGDIGSIQELNGQLLITQTLRAHYAVSELISQLPGTRSPEAAVEAKLASAWKAFLAGGGIARPFPNVLYRRPVFTGVRDYFDDLTIYAPGLNTTRADVLAVLEAEGPRRARGRRGWVDPAARKLIDAARAGGWQTVTFGAAGGTDAVAVTFDGAGRYACRRAAAGGLAERVICDGRTLLHLYDEIGLGARRTVSRFHRRQMLAAIPWLVAPVEDLAVEADVTCVDERTVAVTSVWAQNRYPEDERRAAYLRMHLVFGPDGRLAERRVVAMPDARTILRETYDPNGTVRVLDGTGRVLAERKYAVALAAAPDLTPDLSELLVLPMPMRTREHVLKTRKLDEQRISTWTEDDALAYVAATILARPYQTTGQWLAALRRLAKASERIGVHVLLYAKGSADVIPEKLRHLPVAKYLLASREAGSPDNYAPVDALGDPRSGFIGRLARFRCLWMQDREMQSGEAAATDRQVWREQVLDYAEKTEPSAFTWALLSELADNRGDSKSCRRRAATFDRFGDIPALRHAARYEAARALLHAGDTPAAAARFQELYKETIRKGTLPAIDESFHAAMKDYGWKELIRGTAAGLAERGASFQAVTLAWQSRQAGDADLGAEMIESALADAPRGLQLPLRLAALQYYWNTERWDQADGMISTLLDDGRVAEMPALWRAAAHVADRRGRMGQALACIERAIDIEHRHLPEKIDVRTVRARYSDLLSRYEKFARAVAAPGTPPPRDLVARVIRAADRWRALDVDATGACNAAAAALHALGERDLAWDYVTTPVAAKPFESGAWVAMAKTLGKQDRFDLADRAYAAAFEQEGSNARILWERAELLARSGKGGEASTLYRRIAEGKWPPQFNGVQRQAKRKLAGK